MPPKSKDNSQKEQAYQAVIVADSFNKRYRPLTLDTPRCLLPLANTPMIEYTLELLALNGIQEIFIVCCAHAKQIQDYFSDSQKWSHAKSPKITVIISEKLLSLGDAIRDLDAKQILENDFILISGGDVVANCDLIKALKEHKERREKNKNAIMTMILREASPNHRTRAKGEEALFIIDPNTKKCMRYIPMEPYPKRKRIEFDASALMDPFNFKGDEIDVRNDLIDCQIDICSLEVLADFTENFDYQDIRRHFVHETVQSEFGRSIYVHVIKDQYAARARTTQMYDAISKDVLSRWTFPMVPDANLLPDQTYTVSRQIYTEHSTNISMSAQIGSKVMIGGNTKIGANVKIYNSTIGRRCVIGDNVVIRDSYIWNDVKIEAGSSVEKSIIANKVKIKKNAKIERGCLIANGVVIGAGKTLPPMTKISLRKQTDDVDDDDESDIDYDKEAEIRNSQTAASGSDVDVVGKDGKGFLWVEPADVDDGEKIDKRNVPLGYIGYVPPVDEDEEEEESTAAEESDDEAEAEAEEELRRARQMQELKDTLIRAHEQNVSVETAAFELNNVKMAENLSYDDLREVIIPFVLSKIDKVGGVDKNATIVFKRWGNLIKRFIHSPEDQTDALELAQSYCEENEDAKKILLSVLKQFYEMDIAEEEAIESWYDRNEKMKNPICKIAKPFVDWLRSADWDEEDD